MIFFVGAADCFGVADCGRGAKAVLVTGIGVGLSGAVCSVGEEISKVLGLVLTEPRLVGDRTVLGVAEVGRVPPATVAERATVGTGTGAEIGDTTLDLRQGFAVGWIGVADLGRAVEVDAGDCLGVATVAARVSDVGDTTDCF